MITFSIRSCARHPSGIAVLGETLIREVTWSKHLCSSTGVSMRFHNSMSVLPRSWSCNRVRSSMMWYTEHNANIEHKKYSTQRKLFFRGNQNF
jgi:hypothetical protein